MPDPRPLAPICYSDLDGRTYHELAFDRTDSAVRDSLCEVCLICGGIGRWSSLYADAIYVAPRGHRMEYLDEPRTIVIDSCHKNRAV